MISRWCAAALAALLFGAAPLARAESFRYCDRPLDLSIEEKDRLLRLGAVIKDELDRSGQPVALMSRSGLALDRFGLRYSHMGLSLRDSPDTPWAVRQLYYACDERRPRIYDQGVSGFMLGTDDPELGYVSVVLLPPAAGEALARSARDNRQALSLLGAAYSANAYAYGMRYQNCNQWVAEMMAIAWGASPSGDDPRAAAQAWLRQQGYQPEAIEAGGLLMLASFFVPWVHSDDHPKHELELTRYRVSMPHSLEDFVRATQPGATRLEFCHTPQHIVVHRGWERIAEGCVPGPGDTVIALGR